MEDITVVIAEDDPYSSDLMAFLLARDRRTRVVAEGPDALYGLDEGAPEIVNADVILLDTELPADQEWTPKLIRRLRPRHQQTKMICTATMPNANMLSEVIKVGGNGYLIKDEVHYALGEIVLRAAAGAWVMTPFVDAIAAKAGITLPASRLMVNGTYLLDRLTHREQTIARLGILFNQPYKDIGDELRLTPGHVRDTVSSLYEKLGLNAILEEKVQPERFFHDEEVLALFHEAIAHRKENPRAGPGLKTLAFHLLTLPEIEE